MKKLILFFLLLPSLALAGEYKVIHVVDGDTIDIICHGKKERIRMLCVDTPESVHPDQSRNTPMGKKASGFTKARLYGKYIDLEFESKTRGKYGRLLAYIIVDGENFNVELVREGWSPYYTKYGNSEKHHHEFTAAEKAAREARLNIWAQLSEPKKPQFPSCEYVRGNVKSKTFHKSSCRHFYCKNCTKVFQNRHQAIKAGYKPCGMCNP